ncbi:hypothetical protein OHA77_38765 [Streptosporangium sp. NBC_01639]|uniref:hypothetical protein n=1 Tax=Streptosporangium sp. NBC_01639 TaxID=2975948 RepID=UPI00386E393E|nr:hypothetical protein OHA77_38765 [Streptosporangium sp. NBC_01639]
MAPIPWAVAVVEAAKRLSPVPTPISLAAALGWTVMTMYAGVRHVSVGSQTHTTAV